MSVLWGIVVFGCLAWYTGVTLYITIKGSMDIQTMLDHLKHASDSMEKKD